MNIDLAQFALDCGGQFSATDGAVVLSGVCHDSRQIAAGELFVCLNGAHHRGEQFIDQAVSRGAAAALVHDDFHFTADTELPLVRAKDTASALRRFALARRADFHGHCSAVTGSLGKTTCKELLSTLLRHSGAKVLATKGNLNTEIGLWLTLTQLESDTDFLVLEMGARQQNDIAILCRQARPELGLITTIEQVHLSTFHDIETIIKTKAELYQALPEDGWAVLNLDCPHHAALAKNIQCRHLCLFSCDPNKWHTDPEQLIATEHRAHRQTTMFVQARPIPGKKMCQLRIDQRLYEVACPLPAAHHLTNQISAVAAAVCLGIPIETIISGCHSLRLPPRRFEPIELTSNNLLIDDSYNANPAALLSGIDSARSSRERLWLVVGELAELGSDEDALLDQLSHRLMATKFDLLIGIGRQAKRLIKQCPERAITFDDQQQALDWLLRQRPTNTCLYFKASRSARLDEMVDSFVQERRLCSTN